MSIATIAAEELVALRGDRADIWAALVNATTMWDEVSPELFRDLDWKTLIQAAEYHGVLPIVCQRVLENEIVSLPAEDRVRLRRSYHANLLRALPLADEVGRVLGEFDRAGVPIIPYKGSALAEQLWGNSALRVCDDLDFLVEPESVGRAGELLGRLGYRRLSPVVAHLRPALLRNASEEQFQHRETGLLLELQWSPAPRVFAVRYEAEKIWPRVRFVAFNSRAVLAPSPEDLLMLLSIHGWKHNWSRLIWIGDIAQLIRSHAIDWDWLRAECRSQGNVRLLSLALRVVERVYGSAVPQPFAFRDAALEALANELVERMISMDPCSYRDWHRCMLAVRDSQADQARQMLSFLFTPGLGEYAACKLPAWASAGYRVVRLGRLISNAGAKSRE